MMKNTRKFYILKHLHDNETGGVTKKLYVEKAYIFQIVNVSKRFFNRYRGDVKRSRQ